MLDSTVLVRRQETPLWLSIAAYAGGLIVGLAVSAALLVFVGVPPEALIDEFLVETFLTSDGLAQTATAAIPLILVGLSATVAMRVSFWNIGVEGQLWLGAIGASWIALGNIGPEAVRLPLMLVAAAVAGAAWIALPMVLKMRWNVSEVISTLLLGNVAFLLVQHLLFGAWRDPANSFPISAALDPAEEFSPLGWGQVHTGLWLALGAGVVVWFVLERTRIGFYARAVGLNPSAARATGLPVRLTTSLLALASGALSGLAGASIVAGTEHRLTQTLGNGYLFSAIVIAFLARARPVAAVAIAFVLGGVFTAGSVLKVFYSISEAVIVLIQGAVLLSVLSAEFFATYRINRPPRGNAQ
ncbi:simple sugar transport system permease protein [Pseudoxanthobacter soli DSM 19599]|uniref:Simple sugar transport system permease protein n=1 Tax=Pseudoxanthobacter soli DSM 19599 TaxID=1123029 RepID=A0A1M7ZS63_9HYPH|nr:ABC transporter permease [Pseudoxanthobacter soli]SHO67496.1 simple sugar transport system permease protein [Pseudoxanthobacter soli DSM 19599]